jgi:hypothetical protein
MKKTILCLTAMAAMIISVSVFASSNQNNSAVHSHNHDCSEHVHQLDCTTHVHMEGKNCNGTVGCSCPGFSPITNGNEWQKAYCRHCGHSRSVHK